MRIYSVILMFIIGGVCLSCKHSKQSKSEDKAVSNLSSTKGDSISVAEDTTSKGNVLNTKKADPISHAHVHFAIPPFLILPSGEKITVNKPSGTLLFNRSGCKIIQESPEAILFNRVDAINDPMETVFDSLIQIKVPAHDSLRVSICAGADFELKGNCELKLKPCNNLKGITGDIYFQGHGRFDIGKKYKVITPHLSLYSPLPDRGSFVFEISDYPKDTFALVKNRQSSSLVSGFGKSVILSPVTSAKIYKLKKNIEFADLTYDTAKDRIFVDSYQIENRTVPAILKDMARWFGMKGFACINGIDTIERGGFGTGEGDISMDLWWLVNIYKGDGLYIGIRNDSIIASKTPIPNGLRTIPPSWIEL